MASQSLDPTYPLFPICAFLGFLVSLIPLPWHIQAWNAGTCMYMFWTAISCLIEFVNSLVWKGNIENPAPVWCDISSKLLLGAGIGIPASALCISRRLYSIASAKTASITRQDKRRAVIVDLCIALGIPVLIMILHVVVQPHRFDILEDIGCYAVIYNTLPAYFLYFMWPVVLGSVSFVYSSLTLRCFWIRRVQFGQLIASNPNMNMSRYFRLMLLAVMDILCTLPLGIYSIYISTHGIPLAPWISWEETHFDFGRVATVPAIFWRSDKSFEIAVELTRWIYVFSAFLFFALFGFASEARKNYGNVIWWCAGKVGISQPATKHDKSSVPSWRKPLHANANASGSSLPVFVNKGQASPANTTHPFKSLGSTYGDSGTEVELAHFPETDIEKSAGLPSPSSTRSAPPEYTWHESPIDDSVSISVSDEPHRRDALDLSSSASLRSHSPSPASLPVSPPAPLPVDINPPAPPLSQKTSSFTLRSMHSLDRIYLSHTIPRPPSPAPFSELEPIPGSPNAVDAPAADDSPEPSSRPYVRSPTPIPPSSSGVVIQNYHRPLSPTSAYPRAMPHTQRARPNGLCVMIHTTETRSES
ncbi:hypothetical protein HGRIS_007139 [Hohenbuehelia grisea]|uniref:Pheromone receptor n=1 Tax=Hohenbuehelia grisea TaxID=104357 RepID=A0ABR3JB60_9AGAR